MALEQGHRATSPTTSGRSSPSPWLLRKGAEEGLHKNDKSFRRYAQSIERALSFFDTPQQEWADYISFLARLLKALQVHPGEIHAIPHSATVATRLAQCMNPALPSGVHQKALFLLQTPWLNCFQKDALSRDFNLYFPGLAALPSFASLNVRPLFVSLLEEHVLTLNPEALRPALKSIILCLLPGLEEETSEDFERLVQVLDRLSFAVKLETDINVQKTEEPDSYFWQCLFLAAITNPPRRQGALAYLVRRLPTFGSSSNKNGEDPTSEAEIPRSAQVVISPEPGLLIRCFAAGLADEQILIQRGFLDLLVSRLPLDSAVFRKKVGQADLERLVAAAAGVVARRDMSLNRRLWSWFLGPEPSTGTEDNEIGDAGEETSQSAIYLSRYGLRPLIRSMLAMIKKDTLVPAARARPFRICLSLMDRWEVGGLVVPEIFIPALQSVERYSHSASKEQVDEVMRSASIFFDGVESGLIWGKLLELMAFALKPSSSASDEQTSRLKLARFIVNRFNVREEEMLIHHMPLMIIAVLHLIMQYILQGQDSRFYSPDVATKALDFVDWLVQHIPERVLQSNDQTTKLKNNSAERGEVFNSISNFYFKSQGNLELQDTPLSVNDQAHFAVSLASTLFTSVLLADRSSSMVEVVSRILATLLHKSRNFDALQDFDILSVLQKALTETTTSAIDSSASYHLVVAICAVLIPLQTARPSSPFVEHVELPSLIHPLVKLLWHYLSPWRPRYHVESVRCLWQLHSLSASSRLVEASITSLMCSSTADSAKDVTAEAGSRFAVLWTHTINERGMQAEKGSRPPSRSNSTMAIDFAALSAGGIQPLLTRPLFRLLDALEVEGSETFVFVRSWLEELPSLGRVFDFLATHIRPLNVLKRKGDALQSTLRPTAITNTGSSTNDDIKECLYFLKTILNLLRWSSAHTWATLVEDKVPPLDGSQLNAEPVTLQVFITQLSMRALAVPGPRSGVVDETVASDLHRTAVAVLKHILTRPRSAPLKEFELEVPLMSLIRVSSPSLQSMLLETIIPALKLRYQRPKPEADGRKSSRDIVNTLKRVSISQDGDGEDQNAIMPPSQLIECLRSGFTSPSSRLILDEWVKFLAEVLPLFENSIFQNLLPLVEIFCGQVDDIFDRLRTTFKTAQSDALVSPESSLISLMNGLEQILEKAHSQLIVQESKPAATKSPEMQQGFFGSVAGVFSTETAPQTRSATANNRLTAILCFQDTVRICFSIWSWNGYSANEGKQDGSSQASFSYSSLRLRNRARKILEHLFAAEGLECLETLAVIWCQSSGAETRSAAVLGLLNVLNGGQPKHTIPAIFNAIYSRTSPGALEPSRTSTLTSNLSDIDLVAFLVAYTGSLEDDAMDEIWPDCMTFLKDLLGNPMPHRQILPTLLEFIALLARKVDNTSLGEQRRMRKELGDLFTRLLTATFTTRSLGFLQDPSQTNLQEKSSAEDSIAATRASRAVDVVSILASIVPDFSLVLIDNDRITNLATAISTNIIAPSIRAKSFPTNISDAMLDLFYRLSRAAQGSKAIKKDTSDAFNDPRFFSFSYESIKQKWLPLLQHWTISDKERIPDLLSRLFAPTTAGIIGFGATSARLEADRKTQLNLRRISLLIISGVEDAFVPILPSLQEKLVELLVATPSTSPSSSTRAEIFMVLRALILKTSPVPLAPLWPTINAELTIAISAVIPDDDHHEVYNNQSILMACKLLNTLIALAPEEFQLHEWLYIADTIDAVYRPTDTPPTALTDAVAETLADTTDYAPLSDSAVIDDAPTKPDANVPLLDSIIAGVEADILLQRSDATEDVDVTALSRQELAARVLRPFFGQLSLWAFEERYAMRSVEREIWMDGLIKDICGGGVAGEQSHG